MPAPGYLTVAHIDSVEEAADHMCHMIDPEYSYSAPVGIHFAEGTLRDTTMLEDRGSVQFERILNVAIVTHMRSPVDDRNRDTAAVLVVHIVAVVAG